jgi:hypothetical protein
LLRGVFLLRLSRVTTGRVSASRMKSMGLGLGRVILGNSVDLGLGDAPTALGLGVTLAGGVFLRLRAFVGLGEPLVPLRLGGSGSRGVALEAFGLRGFSVLGVSLPIWGSFMEESSSISCGALYSL